MNRWMRVGGSGPWLLLSLLASMGAGCASAAGEDDFGAGGDEILGGMPHDGDPSTVYLMTSGRFGCTGSLVAPRVVLTAMHCVEGGTRGMSIGVGPRADGSREYARVTAARTPRGGGFEGNDIAVLLLDRAGDLTPYALGTDAPVRGAAIVGVGYGQTSDASRAAGRKYRGTSTIGSVTANEIITSGPLSCYGDSGGPLFDASGRVIGVVSRGTASTCGGGRTIYTRVDAHRAMIDAAIRETGGMPGEGTADPGTDDGSSDDPPVTPPGDVIDICAAPFEGEIAVGATLTVGCALPAGARVTLIGSAPQEITTTLTIEGTTHPERVEDMPVYRFRPRDAATPFQLAVRGTNTRRPMPLRIELAIE